MSNNHPFPPNRNRYPPSSAGTIGGNPSLSFGSIQASTHQTAQGMPQDKKQEVDDGWNEAVDDDNEKVNWSDMPVNTPIISNRPEIGDTPERGSMHNNQQFNIPSVQTTAQMGDDQTQPNVKNDGGWVSGYKTSPPSHPFHRNRETRPPYVSPQYQGRGRPNSIYSQNGNAEDNTNQYPIPPQRVPYPGNAPAFTNDSMDGNFQPPRHPQMNRPRGFERAISSTLRNPAPPIYNMPTSNEMASNAPTHPSVEVPTYTAPIRGPIRQQVAGFNDANRIPVPNAKQWGKPASPEPSGKYEDAPIATIAHNPPATISQPNGNHQLQEPTWSDIGSPSQADWDKGQRLNRWVQGVPPVAPVSQPTPQTSAPPSEVGDVIPKDEQDNEALRLASPSGPAPPVNVEYSDDEEDDKTPALTPHRTASPVQEESEVIDPATIKIKADKPPPILTVAAEGADLPTTPPSDPSNPPNGPRRHRQRNGIDNSWGSTRTHWWKRLPHPMFSPRYAKQRIHVKFHIAIRTDLIKTTLIDHFSKWGPLKGAWHFEANGNSCDKGCVVFEDAESVDKVFLDPQSRQCPFRSTHSAAPSDIELTITDSSSSNLSRTVLIKLTGPRADQRSRSASPQASPNYPKDDNDAARVDRLSDHHTSSLPRSIILDAAPRRGRNGNKVFWSVKIRPTDPRQHRRYLSDLKVEAGLEPIFITEVDLGRRIPEREIVPKICDYFAEISDIYPPTAKGQGWRVTMSGFHDARHLMDELQRVPGFFVRWADEGDGFYTTEDHEVPPSTVADEYVTPIHRMQNEMTGKSSKPNRRWIHDLQAANGDNELPDQTPFVDQPATDPQPHETNLNVPPSAEYIHQPIPHVYDPAAGYSPNHPRLRRSLMHTYKGRPLVEDLSGGEPRYIDQRAVFVGRLVKNSETGTSLLKRFERYGKVATIEYNPTISTTTYSTARVLYQDKESADRAIVHENNQVSFGSVIKVESRKVLPTDVVTKEMYIDDMGRAISPSMVSQYSPHSPTLPAPSTLPATHTTYPIGQYSPPQVPNFAAMPHMQFGMWYHPQLHQPSAPPMTYPMPLYHPPVSSQNPTCVAPEVQATLPSPAMPTQMQLPMLCAAWGIGYLPPGATPLPLYPYQQTVQIPPAPNNQSQGYDIPPPEPIPAPEISTHAPSDSPSFELPEGISSRSKITPIAFTTEDGMFKAVYDPKDLKEYCNENNITIPERSNLAGMIKDEQVTLLPIQSGGHDPVRQNKSEPTHDLPANQPIGQNQPNQPLWASINDPPRIDNIREPRTVPVPIPFSPVGMVQPLPLPGSSNPDHANLNANMDSLNTQTHPATSPHIHNSNPYSHPHPGSDYQTHVIGSLSPESAQYGRFQSHHLTTGHPLPSDHIPRAMPGFRQQDFGTGDNQRWNASPAIGMNYQQQEDTREEVNDRR